MALIPTLKLDPEKIKHVGVTTTQHLKLKKTHHKCIKDQFFLSFIRQKAKDRLLSMDIFYFNFIMTA